MPRSATTQTRPMRKRGAQPVDHRDKRGDVGGVARPHLRTDRPPLLIDDDADDHLVQLRPVVLGMAALTERFAALTVEIQASSCP